QPGPGPQVVAGVADDGGPAGGAGGGVQSGDPLPGYGEHAERVVVAQFRLAGEREAGQVGEVAAVVGVHAGGVERPAVVRHVVVRVPQRPAQPFALQFAQLVDVGTLDRLQLVRTRGAVLHRLPPCATVPVRAAGTV